jgi:hypothetical protein
MFLVHPVSGDGTDDARGNPHALARLKELTNVLELSFPFHLLKRYSDFYLFRETKFYGRPVFTFF